MTCQHMPIRLCFDILRLAGEDGGPIKEFVLEGNGQCFECHQDFNIFRVRLELETVPSLAAINICEHMTFQADLRVDRLRSHVNSRPRHVVTGTVCCYDCGRKFKPVMFQLKPTAEETPLIIPTDREIEEIGRSEAKVIQ